MRSIMKLLAAVFAPMKWVLRTTARGAAWVLEAPAALLGGLFGGGGGSPEPDERDVARDAASQAQAQQTAVDARAQTDAAAQSVLRIAKALRGGTAPNPEDAAALAPEHLRYLLGLRKPELGIVAAASLVGLKARRALVQDLTPPEGCRSVEQVAEDMRAVPVSPDEHRLRTVADRIRAKRLAAPADKEHPEVAILLQKHARNA